MPTDKHSPLRALLSAIQDIQADPDCIPRVEYHRLGRLCFAAAADIHRMRDALEASPWRARSNPTPCRRNAPGRNRRPRPVAVTSPQAHGAPATYS